jgi:hypothetical protein
MLQTKETCTFGKENLDSKLLLSKCNSLTEIRLHDISLKDISNKELKQINGCPKLTLINISGDKIEKLKSRIVDVTDK